MKIILIAILIRSFGIDEADKTQTPAIDGQRVPQTREQATGAFLPQGRAHGLVLEAARLLPESKMAAPNDRQPAKAVPAAADVPGRRSRTAATLPGYQDYLAALDGSSVLSPASAEELMQADPFASLAAFRAQTAAELKNVLAAGRNEKAPPLASIPHARAAGLSGGSRVRPPRS